MIPLSLVRSPPALLTDSHTADNFAVVEAMRSRFAWEIAFWWLFDTIQLSLNECETISK
jgi:hypothetical protein